MGLIVAAAGRAMQVAGFALQAIGGARRYPYRAAERPGGDSIDGGGDLSG
jgi:hypothetical protein